MEPVVKPTCRVDIEVTGNNVLTLVGRVHQTLVKAGQEEQAKEFLQKADVVSANYDAVLALCFGYVDVELWYVYDNS